MKIRVNVKLNQANIKKIEQAMVKALPLTMEAMKTEVMTMQVVPKETGTLEIGGTVTVKGTENQVEGTFIKITSKTSACIGWDAPYARRLYYNPQYNFRTDKNPNAQGRWLDPFIHGDKKEWLAKAYGLFLMQQAGGVIK